MKSLKIASVLIGALAVAGVASSAHAAPADGDGDLGHPATSLAPGGSGLSDLGSVTNLAHTGSLSGALGGLGGLGGLEG